MEDSVSSNAAQPLSKFTKKFKLQLARTEIISRREKKAATRVTCGLYCLILCSFGVVFPISDALTNSIDISGYYTESYQIVLFICAIGAMLYVFIDLVRRAKPKPSTVEPQTQVQPNPGWNIEFSSLQRVPGSDGIELSERERIAEGEWVYPEVCLGGEGSNLYYRIGGIVFALGSITFCELRLIAPYEGVIPRDCYPLYKQVANGIMVIFVVMQTVLFVKYHQLVVNRCKPFVRFCMMHLVATNLALWLSATTHETVADVRKKLTEERNETDVCHSGGAYYDKAVGFIYPCVVEYGLFGAGAAYIMYLNVGKGFSERTVVESDTDEPSAPFCDKTIWHKRCGRAYVGLIVGVVIMILTLIGVIVYHTASGNMEYTFLVMEILLIMIAASAGIFVYMLLRDLKYVGLEEDNFDGSLLIITQAGVYALYLFIMLGAINAIRTGDEFNYGVFFLVQSILCMGQSTLQTYTVLDGFSRSAHKTEHAEKKPGQNVITLLICVNFSMWMSATFLFANADDQDLFSDYFGIIPWSMITRMFSPLVIFYRFQASICLSDIWENAYKTRGKAE